MEAVHNYVDIMFMYRAVDYSGKALLRVCHDIRYFERMVSRDKEGERKIEKHAPYIYLSSSSLQGERKQLKMMEKFVNDVFAMNAASGTSGTAPVTYKQALKKARQVLAAEGISDSNLFSGDAYSAARSGEEKQKRYNEEKTRDKPAPRDNRSNNQADNRRPERRQRETKEHIGMFCGNWNNGADCDERKCSRRHRCSRIIDGSFCRERHRITVHQ